MPLRIANDYEELAFFALACVPIAPGTDPAVRAASMYSARLPSSAARSPFREDEIALQSLAPSGILTAQFLPRLFSSVDAFLRASRRPIADLRDVDVADARSLAAIRAGDLSLAELLFCDMALAASAFIAHEGADASTHARALLAPIAELLAQLAMRAPSLNKPAIVLVGSLGGAGRVYQGAGAPVIYVGCPDATEAALLALHELAVAFGPRDYRLAERAAIDACSRLTEGTSFEDAFARRMRSLDLGHIASSEAATAVTRSVLERLRGV